MVDTDTINQAIAAHARWKHFLREATQNHRSEQSVAEIRSDVDCEFGQWLDALPEADRQSPHWQKVRTLHAEFHLAAARVLELALAGREREAQVELGTTGSFTRVSSELTVAMADWKRVIHHDRRTTS